MSLESETFQDPMEEQLLQCTEFSEDSLHMCTSAQEPGDQAEEEEEEEEAQAEVSSQMSEPFLPDAEFGETDEQQDPMPSWHGPQEEVPGAVVSGSSPDLRPGLDGDGAPEGALHESSAFSCEHCERRFSTKQGLERHTHIHASASRRAHAFKCRYCGKSFGSQVGRRRHERRHESGPVKKAGQAPRLVPSVRQPGSQSDSSGPDCSSASGATVTDVLNGGTSCEASSAVQKVTGASDGQLASSLEEIGASKELHPCKYCKKVFGTHTNMRRHQRRIHERHLLPKGVRRNGALLQEVPKRPPVEEAVSGTAPVYVPSGDVEDEGGQEEYMVDISSNISENLSLYIDGKILSTSTVSNCEVIQVDSSSAALLGLDAFIINPDQIGQVLKVDAGVCTVKEAPAQPVTKRRTATPPILPSIKTELESLPVLSSLPSAPSSSSSSSSSSSVAGAVFSPPIETLAFQKEKTLYLSPKLKQLLQTQDGHKSTSPLMTDKNRPGPPPPMAALPTTSGRFKRRTASPPNSSQHSPDSNTKPEGGISPGAKLLKGNCQSSGSPQSSSKDEMEGAGVGAFNVTDIDWPSARSGGSSCNQQPLDLSSAVSKRDEGLHEGPGEVILDLSMHRKGCGELETNGSQGAQPLLRRRKPDTSVLEKVLLNEYGGVQVAGEASVGNEEASSLPAGEGPAPCSPHSCFPLEEGMSGEVITSVALHPPPPSLTPVTMHPPSPCMSPAGSPTPPPPVLPTAPSPQPQSQPTDVQFTCSPTQNLFPVLSPRMSPGDLQGAQGKLLLPPDHNTHVVMQDMVNCENVYQLTEPINPSEPKSHSFLTDPSVNQIAIHSASEYSLIGGSSSTALSTCNISSFNVTHRAVVIECTLSIESSQNLVSLTVPENPPANNLVLVQETKQEEQQKTPCQTPPQSLDPPVLVDSTSVPETSSSSQSLTSESPAPPEIALSPKASSEFEDNSKPNDLAKKSATTAEVAPVSPPAASQRVSKEPVQQETFFKSFTCNVCEAPFPSIKELSQHGAVHAEGWPFKCEFCVLLFNSADALLEHRSSLHGVGTIYMCTTCSKEFAFLCNLQQHQKDLHPGQTCSHTEVENGKLRPQNHNGRVTVSLESSVCFQEAAEDQASSEVKKEEDLDDSTEELYTTIKIMASEVGKPKGPNVKLGINQHYPSFKPPPFPYHNRTPAGSIASATNFTTRNIPQTFSTAIRCTKCGRSFVSMPELHRHILACASASDKKRYTPKKNPIPLKEFGRAQNGVVPSAAAANAPQNTFRRMGQSRRLSVSPDSSSKVKLGALSHRKTQPLQKAIAQRSKTAIAVKRSTAQMEEQEVYVCPHCRREFTYRGSLNKHVAVSCPMKPPPKKTRKGAGAANVPVSLDRSGSLRRRTTGSDMRQQGASLLRKTLMKTRGQTAGPGTGISLKHQPHRAKMAAHIVRPKRPASFPAASIPFKKSKTVVKGSSLAAQQLPTLSLGLPPVTTLHDDEDIQLKRPAEVSLLQSPTQPRRDKRLPVARMRVGGPVTRSLQLANTNTPTLVGVEGAAAQEPRETQDPSVRLPG